MSFTIAYRPFLSVTAQSETDSGTRTTLGSVSFEPFGDCRLRLADHQLLFRRHEGGFRLFYASNPFADPPVLGAIRARTRFRFSLAIRDPDFFKRFEPDLSRDTGRQLYFDNLKTDGAIQTKNTLTLLGHVQAGDTAVFCSTVFETLVEITEDDSPEHLFVKDKFRHTAAPIIDKALPDIGALTDEPESTGGPDSGTGSVVTSVDLPVTIDMREYDELGQVVRAHPTGAYVLETDRGTFRKRTIYVDPELVSARVPGVLDLYWEAPQAPEPQEGTQYFIRFRAR